MDLNVSRNSEIEQFLFDVRDHFRASLETSEYENTSNIFHVTAADATEKLLQRCEQLLAQCATKQQQHQQSKDTSHVFNGLQTNAIGDCTNSKHTPTPASNGMKEARQQPPQQGVEEVSYLDMTAGRKKQDCSSREYNDGMTISTHSDKTFRCSTRITATRDGATTEEESDSADEKAQNDDDDGDDDERQIYDICQVSQMDADETQKAITPDLELMHATDCPYMDLPAGHLPIQNSSKYGQLQRIEKRLFFDQSKKCYCGILNDWLLCYADGPTSSNPTLTVHLKAPYIQIEHSGEGKRREICFQITTADPNKKFVFQANNEVDAKEWIHAIEAAIRGDTSALVMNRKLPTPPVQKKLTFISNHAVSLKDGAAENGDYIYEEPLPFYQVNELHEPTVLPEKQKDSIAIAREFEYDIPKCPPQALKSAAKALECQVESETAELLNPFVETSATEKSNAKAAAEKSDFQSKVKDVHSKLSSQLAAVPNLKKAAKKTYSCSSTESETVAISLATSPATIKDIKKQKKSNTPQTSPQKSSNSIAANNAAKNWFLNRLSKTTSSARSSNSSTPAKCKQSEKENLLNSLEMCDVLDGADFHNNNSSNPASPILKSSTTAGSTPNKSKVNLIIKEFEANGHLAMFSMETLAGSAVATFSSFCENDCNNYEPIMTVNTPPSSFMKKV